LNTPGEEIPFLLQEYIETGKKITNSIYQIMLYGGGMTREEGFHLTYNERAEIVKMIDEKLKNSTNLV
jgi:hypothetical protein